MGRSIFITWLNAECRELSWDCLRRKSLIDVTRTGGASREGPASSSSPSTSLDDLALPLSAAHTSDTPTGCDHIPTHRPTNLLEPSQISTKDQEMCKAGANCSLNPMPFALAYNFHWQKRLLVNITMHLPNLHPGCLHQSPGPNQVILGQRLHTDRVYHHLVCTPLYHYWNTDIPPGQGE